MVMLVNDCTETKPNLVVVVVGVVVVVQEVV